MYCVVKNDSTTEREKSSAIAMQFTSEQDEL